MRAIILAAGKGKIENELPMPLQEVQGKKVIEYQLEALQKCGISEVVLVMGYQAAEIKQYLGERVKYVENQDYARSSSAYSLWLARDHAADGFIYLNGDLIFEPEVLQKVLDSRYDNAFAFDRKYDFTSDMQKIVLLGERVIHHDKNISADIAHGEAVGPVKISKDFAKEVFWRIQTSSEEQKRRQWVYPLLSDVAKCVPMHGVNITGLRWCEVDTLEDLRKAEAIFGERKPFIVLMYGNPATGKTHTSRALQEYCSQFGRVSLISTFNLREELGLVDLYSPEERKAVYETMIERIKMVLRWKNANIILDGNFTKFESRRKIYDLAQQHGYQVLVVHCQVSSAEAVKQRLEKRASLRKSIEHAATTMELYQMIWNASDSLECEIKAEVPLSIIGVNTEHETISSIHVSRESSPDVLSMLQNGIKYGFGKVNHGLGKVDER